LGEVFHSADLLEIQPEFIELVAVVKAVRVNLVA
jgi:hypothetical protein